MNIKQNDMIILNSRKTPNDILGNIQINAKQNKWNNQLQKNILYGIRGNKFVIYIPWNAEKREFRGSVYRTENGSTLEGRFLLPKKICCIHMGFWSIAWGMIIFLFLYVPVLIRDSYFCFILVGCIVSFLFDLWYLLIYRNKEYENKIIYFLKKCLD